MIDRKLLGTLLDITFLILIAYMVVFLFNKANEFASESKQYEVWPPGSISDDVVEQLLRKPAN